MAQYVKALRKQAAAVRHIAPAYIMINPDTNMFGAYHNQRLIAGTTHVLRSEAEKEALNQGFVVPMPHTALGRARATIINRRLKDNVY